MLYPLTTRVLAVAMLAAGLRAQQTVVFKGMCDASGAVWAGKHWLVVNDEDQAPTLIRRYDPAMGGGPVATFELPSRDLLMDRDEPEIDLEGITRIGDTYWVIGSHSRSPKGSPRWSRQNLVAFKIDSNAATQVRSITSLVPALSMAVQRADKKIKDLDPARDPKDGGLSIEGLAATPTGDLLIGIRSPLGSDGRAMVALLTKPEEALRTNRADLFLRDVFQLPLKGVGVRDIIYDAASSRYLIVGGPAGDGGPFGIWSWDFKNAPKLLKDITPLVPAETAPEGILRTLDGKSVWILFDEGKRLLAPDSPCGKADPGKQSFRAIRIDLP